MGQLHFFPLELTPGSCLLQALLPPRFLETHYPPRRICPVALPLHSSASPPVFVTHTLWLTQPHCLAPEAASTVTATFSNPSPELPSPFSAQPSFSDQLPDRTECWLKNWIASLSSSCISFLISLHSLISTGNNSRHCFTSPLCHLSVRIIWNLCLPHTGLFLRLHLCHWAWLESFFPCLHLQCHDTFKLQNNTPV